MGDAEMKESNLMTVVEVADHLRCHRTTVYKLLKVGAIPAFKVGSDWRFNPEAIDEWRDSQTNRTEVLSTQLSSARLNPTID
jgi:excisionase family DNA binding protein